MLVVAGLATVANAGIYSGTGGAIPDGVSPISPGVFTSSITVSGDTDYPITAVSLELQGFTHSWIGDIIATLTSPNGTVHTLMNRVGRLTTGSGDSSNVNGNYIFADGGADLWFAATGGASTYVIPGGTYATTGAGSAGSTSMNAAFAGQNGNGLWTLSLSDVAGGDTGGITGWQLTIVPAPGALALAGLGGIVTARRKRR